MYVLTGLRYLNDQYECDVERVPLKVGRFYEISMYQIDEEDFDAYEIYEADKNGYLTRKMTFGIDRSTL